MDSELRDTARNPVFRLGEITCASGTVEIDCLVRNTSEAGALIEVLTTDDIPEVFSLSVPSVQLLKTCRVVRRTKHMLGVAFAG